MVCPPKRITIKIDKEEKILFICFKVEIINLL